MVSLQHPFLAALVTLTVPSQLLLGQTLFTAVAIGATGLIGMLLAKRSLSLGASLTLISMLVLGKAATNSLRLTAPDTALLLVEFTSVLILMEASSVVLTFSGEYSKLRAKDDDFSLLLKQQLKTWLRNQLSSQAKLSFVVLALSVGLLPIAGLTSIPTSQLALSATLALLGVLMLLFLIIHRREPETG